MPIYKSLISLHQRVINDIKSINAKRTSRALRRRRLRQFNEDRAFEAQLPEMRSAALEELNGAYREYLIQLDAAILRNTLLTNEVECSCGWEAKYIILRQSIGENDNDNDDNDTQTRWSRFTRCIKCNDDVATICFPEQETHLCSVCLTYDV